MSTAAPPRIVYARDGEAVVLTAESYVFTVRVHNPVNGRVFLEVTKPEQATVARSSAHDTALMEALDFVRQIPDVARETAVAPVRTVDPEQPVVLAVHEKRTAVIPQSAVRREFVGAVEQEFIQ
jgi:hypothetical protein